MRRDAVAAGLPDDSRPLRAGGTGATAYAEAVSLYLAFAVDKVADRNSAICTWASLREHARNTFTRQAIPMMRDFAESNPFSGSSGNFIGGILSIGSGLDSVHTEVVGRGLQRDARATDLGTMAVISTDPPYYDNIGYADLSDFFYVWLRRSLKPMFPDLFATLAVPKAEELVATPYRHGGKEAAETFFLDGMTLALQWLAGQTHPGFPATVYYAFKQSETRGGEGTASTGWEIFLDAVMQSGFAITGTWPMRTELDRRMVGMGTNAQAAIGPSMAVYTRYGRLRHCFVCRAAPLRLLDRGRGSPRMTVCAANSRSVPGRTLVRLHPVEWLAPSTHVATNSGPRTRLFGRPHR